MTHQALADIHAHAALERGLDYACLVIVAGSGFTVKFKSLKLSILRFSFW